MKRSVLALAPLLLLMACSKPAGGPAATGVNRLAKPETAATPSAGQAPTPAAPAPMLAYNYSVTLSVPGRTMEALVSRHEQACNQAGALACQVLSSEITSDRGVNAAELKLRGEPRWLAGFRVRLQRDAQEAGGSVVSSQVSSEDLTRQIVDTEAALRAKSTLRDRLQQLLATHPGRVEDLLQIEKQLAEVQGEIDAAQSELAVMRGRVDMSTLTLHYEARGQLVSSKAAQPFNDAVRGFFGVVMTGAAAIVYIVAFLIPFAVVVIPVVWLLRQRARRRKAASAPAGPTTES